MSGGKAQIMTPLLLWAVVGLFSFLFGSVPFLPTATAQGVDNENCVPDLNELKVRMEAEALEELFIGNGTRNAPFRYVLCPNTTFYMTEPEQQIIPILDQTWILCGDDGKMENNCVIEDRIFNVTIVLPEVALLRFFSDYQRLLTVFSGISFRNSFHASVAAYDIYPTRVSFLECYWTGSQGSRVIDQQTPLGESVAIGQQTMMVQLNDCIIENEESNLLGMDVPFDAAGTPLNVAIVNQAGTLDINNITVRNNRLNYFVFTVAAQNVIRSSLFTNNVLEEGIHGRLSFLTVTDSRFEFNRYVVGSLSIVDASLESRLNEFHGNSGLADVTVLSLVRTTRTPDALVSSCCFTDGNYLAGPVVTAGKGVYVYDDVYVSETIQGRCPNHPFLESRNDLCFDDIGFYIFNETCRGDCDDSRVFDADICALAPKPSAAPSKSPAPTKSPTPTHSPTVSAAPTDFPTVSPTTLSFAYGGTSSPSKVPTTVVVVPTSQPSAAPVATAPVVAQTAPRGAEPANSNDGFCETGAGPFVCVGVPVIAAAVIIAVALVVVFHRQGGGIGGGSRKARAEVELTARGGGGGGGDDGLSSTGSGMPASELS